MVAAAVGGVLGLLIVFVGYIVLGGGGREEISTPTTVATTADDRRPASTPPTDPPVTTPPPTEPPATTPPATEPPATTGSPTSTGVPASTDVVTKPGELTPTQQQAADEAADYVEFIPSSRARLIEVLTLDGTYTEPDATVAVDSLNIDFNEQALLESQTLIEYGTYARQSLIASLSWEYGGAFTLEEATYAADNVGADWNAEAVDAAEASLGIFDAPNCEEVVDYLTNDVGFTPEEAQYGAEAVDIC